MMSFRLQKPYTQNYDLEEISLPSCIVKGVKSLFEGSFTGDVIRVQQSCGGFLFAVDVAILRTGTFPKSSEHVCNGRGSELRLRFFCLPCWDF